MPKKLGVYCDEKEALLNKQAQKQIKEVIGISTESEIKGIREEIINRSLNET